MSTEQLPVLKNLQAKVEEEARRTSQKFKAEDLKENAQQSHPQENGEKTQVEPRLNINEEEVLARKTNIFGEHPHRTNKVNIFANSKSVNLFSLTQQQHPPTKLDIFKNAINSNPVLEDDDKSLSSQDEEEGHQQIKQPSEFVMKYTYEQRLQKVGQFKIMKFRPSHRPLIEGVVLSVERDPKNGEMMFLVVRSQTTKLVVYRAILLPNTRVESFMGKKENLKLSVVKIGQPSKEEPKGEKGREQKNEVEQVKLQFKDEEQAKRFEQIFNKNT